MFRLYYYAVAQTLIAVGVGKIPYKKDAGPEDVLVFKHYNANEVRFAVFSVYAKDIMYEMYHPDGSR